MVMQKAQIYQADLAPYINIIKKRKWLVILPLLIVMPLVILMLVLQEPAYKSTAAVLIEPEHPNIVGFQEVFKLGPYDAYFQTQYRLISSRPMIEKTLTALDQFDGDTFLAAEQHDYGEVYPNSNHTSSLWRDQGEKILSKIQSIKNNLTGIDQSLTPSLAVMAREKRIEEFQESLKVKPIANTRLINITISNSNPYESARQVNTLAEVYVDQNLKHKQISHD